MSSILIFAVLIAVLAESVFIVLLKRRLHDAEQKAEVKLQESKQRDIELQESIRRESELRREIDRFGEEKAALGRKDLELSQKEEELIRVDTELQTDRSELVRWEASLRLKEAALCQQEDEIRRQWGAAPGVSKEQQQAVSASLYPDFESVSAEAALLKEYSLWRIARIKGDPAGSEEKKEELNRRAEHLSVDFHFIPAVAREEELRVSADCYEALEIGTRLVAKCLDGNLSLVSRQTIHEQLVGLMLLCGDAYCLLKTANRKLGIDLRADPVQLMAFSELKRAGKQNNVYFPHLKEDSLADLETRGEILARLSSLETQLTPLDTEKKKEPVRRRIQDSLRKIFASLPGATDDWNRLVDGITELIQTFRVSAKSAEIREYLTPVIDKIPDDVEKTEPFIRAIQYLEVGPPPVQGPPFEQYSDEVKKVRKAFGNTRVVFVGGTPQPHLLTRIRTAFKLNDLLWEEWSHGDSLDRFRSFLNDGTVQLFLVYIPWCSHKHSLDLPKMVRKAGKSFVRLRKGTGINQIAAAICEQAISRPND